MFLPNIMIVRGYERVYLSLPCVTICFHMFVSSGFFINTTNASLNLYIYVRRVAQSYNESAYEMH